MTPLRLESAWTRAQLQDSLPDRFLLAEAQPGALPVERVLALTKRSRGKFAFLITIGSSPNNDVVVKDEGVSDYHAFVAVLKGGQVMLGDALSELGTWVERRRLTPRRRVELAPGDDVWLGPLRTRYFTRDAFLGQLLARRAA